MPVRPLPPRSPGRAGASKGTRSAPGAAPLPVEPHGVAPGSAEESPALATAKTEPPPAPASAPANRAAKEDSDAAAGSEETVITSATRAATGAAVQSGPAPVSRIISGPELSVPAPRSLTPFPKFCPSCMGRYPADFKVCPRDATPLEDAREDSDPLLGAVLADAFQIVRLVGEGGMARVYEVRHVRLPNKRFAAKVLLPAHAQSPDVVARFQREAEAASGIGHPNVVDVYDVHRTPEGIPYLICEYLNGKDFATLLDEEGKIDIPLAMRVVHQVCRALSAAHARGIVHRDVKPENVFLVGDPTRPQVKVIDFGISKVDSTGGANLTRTGMIMGTPGYMPPEQARGGRVDHRADIYGVGAMLYRALTARLPFDYEDAAEAVSAVLTDDPPRPRSIEPSIPPALEMVIERAMAKNPEDRYASMDELDAELEPFSMEGRTISMVPADLETSAGTNGDSRTKSGATTVLSATPAGKRHKTNMALERATREAQWARPNIVILSVVAYVWAVALLVDAASSVVRNTKPEGAANSATETLLVLLGVIALSLTPAVFWTRHLYRSIWGNSVRSVEVAAWLKQVTVSSMLGYAGAAMLLRLIDTTVLSALDPGGPAWSPLLLAVAATSAGATYLGSRYRKRR